MKKPLKKNLPARTADYDRNRLDPAPNQLKLDRLAEKAKYHGSPTHKAHPLKFGLPLENVRQGDATLCDAEANFQPAQMAEIPLLLRRGIRAGLVTKSAGRIWSVAEDGWIFEARTTNSVLYEYHGYPVRYGEAIAEAVYDRFVRWAEQHGDQDDRTAAANCRRRYGFGK